MASPCLPGGGDGGAWSWELAVVLMGEREERVKDARLSLVLRVSSRRSAVLTTPKMAATGRL